MPRGGPQSEGSRPPEAVTERPKLRMGSDATGAALRVGAGLCGPKPAIGVRPGGSESHRWPRLGKCGASTAQPGRARLGQPLALASPKSELCKADSAQRSGRSPPCAQRGRGGYDPRRRLGAEAAELGPVGLPPDRGRGRREPFKRLPRPSAPLALGVTHLAAADSIAAARCATTERSIADRLPAEPLWNPPVRGGVGPPPKSRRGRRTAHRRHFALAAAVKRSRLLAELPVDARHATQARSSGRRCTHAPQSWRKLQRPSQLEAQRSV